jgi:hypothetical protein
MRNFKFATTHSGSNTRAGSPYISDVLFRLQVNTKPMNTDLFSKLAYLRIYRVCVCVCVCVYARVRGWVGVSFTHCT